MLAFLHELQNSQGFKDLDLEKFIILKIITL